MQLKRCSIQEAIRLQGEYSGVLALSSFQKKTLYLGKYIAYHDHILRLDVL